MGSGLLWGSTCGVLNDRPAFVLSYPEDADDERKNCLGFLYIELPHEDAPTIPFWEGPVCTARTTAVICSLPLLRQNCVRLHVRSRMVGREGRHVL